MFQANVEGCGQQFPFRVNGSPVLVRYPVISRGGILTSAKPPTNLRRCELCCVQNLPVCIFAVYLVIKFTPLPCICVVLLYFVYVECAFGLIALQYESDCSPPISTVQFLNKCAVVDFSYPYWARVHGEGGGAV